MGITSPIVLIGIGLIVLSLVTLVIVSLIEKKKQREAEGIDYVSGPVFKEEKTEKGSFYGLLTDDDFEYEQSNPLVELYRRQWVKAQPGEDKDQYLLQYLAFRELDSEKEARAAEDGETPEWTEEETSARLDAILKELSEKTGLEWKNDEQLLFEMDQEIPLSELDEYTDEKNKEAEEYYASSEDTDEAEDDEAEDDETEEDDEDEDDEDDEHSDTQDDED